MSQVKSYGVRDMFNFWVRNKRKIRPYLKLKYPGKNKNTELWYIVKSEIAYLKQELLNIDKKIQILEQKDSRIDAFTATTKQIYEFKKEVYNIHEKIKQLSKQDPNKEILLLDFYKFREVIYSYNKEAVNQMIQGETINLNESLGYVYVLKIKRPNKAINWEESLAYKQELLDSGKTIKDSDNPEGKNWLVYFNNNYYLRWAWKKKNMACRVKNNSVYGFYPTASSSKGVAGTRRQLADANKKNPALHLNYLTT